MGSYVSIGVKPKTKSLLESLKREYHIESYDLLLQKMVSGMKGEMLRNIFGLAPKIGEFRRDEFDRGL